MNEKRFYGYKHWTLEEVSRCFNVGKGLSSRSTETRSRNHKWHAIVKRLGLRVEVCFGPVTNDEARVWEITNIELTGTFSTNHHHNDDTDIGCNFTRGGEGNEGWVPTKETRENISRMKKIGFNRPGAIQRNSESQKLAQNRLDVKEKKRKSSSIVQNRLDVIEQKSIAQKRTMKLRKCAIRFATIIELEHCTITATNRKND